MRIFIFILFTFSLLQAQSIDQLIVRSLEKHPSLQTIKHRLSAMDERIAKSQQWANPDLSFFQAARVQLALQIRTTAFTIKELEARIHILRKYSQLARQNIQLYTDTIATSGMSHADSITAELSLSKIDIRRERYNSILQSQKEKLAYLVQKKISTVSNKLSIQKPGSIGKYLNRVTNNPTYQMKLTQNRAANANKKLIDLDTNPDPFVQVGYFNRADYEDYASISVGFSVPLYGTEELNSEIARKETLATQSAALDYKSFLDSEIHANFTKIREAYRIYNIIQAKSLPQIDHMLELSSAAIEEGADLFTYTNILEQKLALEEESIAIKAEFQRTKAKLKALTGEI
jgi:outer membrane protein TolC